MPFTSKAQMGKCFHMNDPKWDCEAWAKETPDIKAIPEKKGNAGAKKQKYQAGKK